MPPQSKESDDNKPASLVLGAPRRGSLDTDNATKSDGIQKLKVVVSSIRWRLPVFHHGFSFRVTVAPRPAVWPLALHGTARAGGGRPRDPGRRGRLPADRRAGTAGRAARTGRHAAAQCRHPRARHAGIAVEHEHRRRPFPRRFADARPGRRARARGRAGRGRLHRPPRRAPARRPRAAGRARSRRARPADRARDGRDGRQPQPAIAARQAGALCARARGAAGRVAAADPAAAAAPPAGAAGHPDGVFRPPVARKIRRAAGPARARRTGPARRPARTHAHRDRRPVPGHRPARGTLPHHRHAGAGRRVPGPAGRAHRLRQRRHRRHLRLSRRAVHRRAHRPLGRHHLSRRPQDAAPLHQGSRAGRAAVRDRIPDPGRRRHRALGAGERPAGGLRRQCRVLDRRYHFRHQRTQVQRDAHRGAAGRAGRRAGQRHVRHHVRARAARRVDQPPLRRTVRLRRGRAAGRSDRRAVPGRRGLRAGHRGGGAGAGARRRFRRRAAVPPPRRQPRMVHRQRPRARPGPPGRRQHLGVRRHHGTPPGRGKAAPVGHRAGTHRRRRDGDRRARQDRRDESRLHADHGLHGERGGRHAVQPHARRGPRGRVHRGAVGRHRADGFLARRAAQPPQERRDVPRVADRVGRARRPRRRDALRLRVLRHHQGQGIAGQAGSPGAPRPAHGPAEPPAVPRPPAACDGARGARRAPARGDVHRPGPLQDRQRHARPPRRRRAAETGRRPAVALPARRRHAGPAGRRRIHRAAGRRGRRARRAPGGGKADAAVRAPRRRLRLRTVRHGQRGHQPVPAGRRRPERIDPQRRRRDVPGQGARPQRLPAVRAVDGRRRRRAPAHGRPAAARDRARRDPPALPAAGRDRDGPPDRRRSPRALAQRGTGPRAARALHPARGGHRLHRPAGRVGAGTGLPPDGMLGDGRVARAQGGGEPVGTPVRPRQRGAARLLRAGRGGPRAAAAAAGSDGIRHHEYGRRAPVHQRPARAGRGAGDRRFRHGLFVARLPEAAAGADAEDRPQLHQGYPGRQGGRSDRHRRHPAGQEHGPGRDRGGRGNGGAGGVPAAPRLHARAGLSVRPAGGAGRIAGDMEGERCGTRADQVRIRTAAARAPRAQAAAAFWWAAWPRAPRSSSAGAPRRRASACARPAPAPSARPAPSP
ncbi:hypothetical protein Lal_00014785 [Lupinus albus]|nr:hypothetical protein Lal_00014785 [Lupinus albus]